MASKSDVRAILQLPQNAGPSTTTVAKKPPAARKPEGISRELYSLIGDSAPSLVAQYARPKFKPKLDINKGKTKWTSKTFTNPGRKDSLQLKHWVKGGGDPAEPGESAFAHYNRPSQVLDYTQEEYTNLLQDDEWTKEETDYLFALAREYDLRFLVMADRYHFEGGPSRRIEDIQERYYAVCRRLIRSRPWAGDEASKTHTLSSYLFDVAQERMRKEYLRGLFNRTPEQIAEEEALYVEVKRLEANERRWAKDRDELLRSQAGVESGLANLNTNWDIGNSFNVGDRDRKNKKRDEPMLSYGRNYDSTAVPNKGKAFDIQNCITRLEPTGTTKSSSTPAHLRSSRIPFPKAHILPKVTAILAEAGISISRLVMPTRANIERLETLQTAGAGLFELKKTVDRIEMEIRMLKAQRESANGNGGGREDSEMRDQSEDREAGGHSGVSMKHLPNQVRKRSMSISSNATSTTTGGRERKKSRRD